MKHLQSFLNSEVLEQLREGALSPAALMINLENEVLQEVMLLCRFNKSRAATQLGISRGTINTLLRDRFGDKYFN